MDNKEKYTYPDEKLEKLNDEFKKTKEGIWYDDIKKAYFNKTYNVGYNKNTGELMEFSQVIEPSVPTIDEKAYNKNQEKLKNEAYNGDPYAYNQYPYKDGKWIGFEGVFQSLSDINEKLKKLEEENNLLSKNLSYKNVNFDVIKIPVEPILIDNKIEAISTPELTLSDNKDIKKSIEEKVSKLDVGKWIKNVASTLKYDEMINDTMSIPIFNNKQKWDGKFYDNIGNEIKIGDATNAIWNGKLYDMKGFEIKPAVQNMQVVSTPLSKDNVFEKLFSLNSLNISKDIFTKEELEQIENSVKPGDPGVLTPDNKEKTEKGLTDKQKVWLKNYWENIYPKKYIDTMVAGLAIPADIINSTSNNYSYGQTEISKAQDKIQDIYNSSYQKEFVNEYLQSPLYTQSSLNPVDGLNLPKTKENYYTQHEIICLLEVLKAWDFSVSFILSQYSCKDRKNILEIKGKIAFYMQQLNIFYNSTGPGAITTSAMTDTIKNIYIFIKIIKENLDRLLSDKSESKLNYNEDKISFNLDLD